MKDYIITNIESLESVTKQENSVTLKLQEIYKEFYTLCKEILKRQDDDYKENYPFPQIINSGDFIEQVTLIKMSSYINSGDEATIDKLLNDYKLLNLAPKGKTSSALEYIAYIESGMSHNFKAGICSTYRILEDKLGRKYFILTFDWDLLDLLSKQCEDVDDDDDIVLQPMTDELNEMFDILLKENLNIVMEQELSLKYNEVDTVSNFEEFIKNDKVKQLKEIFTITEINTPSGIVSHAQTAINAEFDKLYKAIDDEKEKRTYGSGEPYIDLLV